MYCDKKIEGIYVRGDVGVHLQQVPPVIPLDTVHLNLSDNHIEHLTSEDFTACVNITELDLSNNRLQSIAPRTFDDLVNLVELALSHNRLQFNQTSFPTSLFTHLRDLKSLKLHQQMVWSTSPDKVEDFRKIIEELPGTLEKLSIDLPLSPYDVSFASIFSRFHSLTDFKMYCAQRVEMILQDITFESLESLPIANLKIRFASLRSVDPLVFSGFKNMEILHFSDTRGMNVGDLSETFQGLRSTTISTLTPSSFTEWNKPPAELSAECFSRLSLLHHLRRLYLDGTNTHITTVWISLERCDHLEFITLARNRIEPDNFLLTKFIANLEQIRHIDLSFHGTSDEKTIILRLSPSITSLNLAGHNMPNKRHDMDLIELHDSHNLQLFNFSYNSMQSIKEIRFTIPNPNSLLTVDLSHNGLVTLGPNVLKSSIMKGLNLHQLLLSYNKLGGQIHNDTGEMFENYKRLKILDLSENEIDHLSRSIFTNLSSLVELNLSGNLLRSIDFDFSGMHVLRSIDATRNNFPHMYFETKSKSLGWRLKRIQSTSVKREWDFRECSCYTSISHLEMNAHIYVSLYFDECSCPPHTNTFSSTSVQEPENLDSSESHSCPTVVPSEVVISLVQFFVTVTILCLSFTYFVQSLILRIVRIIVSVARNATYIFTISVLRNLPAFIEISRHFSKKCVSACIFLVCFLILKLKSIILKRMTMISKMKPVQILMSRIVAYWSAMIESSRGRWRRTVGRFSFGQFVSVFLACTLACFFIAMILYFVVFMICPECIGYNNNEY